MLITIVLVGSLLHGSIMVDAAGYDEYQYILYDATSGGVWVSNYPIGVIKNFNDRTMIAARSLGTRDDAVVLLSLVYSLDLQDWVTESILTETSHDQYYDPDLEDGTIEGGRAQSWINTGISVSSARIYTNVSWGTISQSYVQSYSNDLSQLPQSLTESDVQDIIDQQINTQTSSGQAAQTIINNTTIQYNSYQAGDISSAEMQQNVTDNINALNDLTPSTLLDAMQINNGLTYNQSIQDQLLNTASPDLINEIASYMREAQNLFNSYRRGEVDQKSVMDRFSNINRFLSRNTYEGGYTSTADLELINMAINTINNYTEQIASFKDIAQDSSDKSQQSDQAELDYLDELTAETTATVEQIAPSKNFTSGQTGEAQEVLDLIWENEFVKRLLPMCAGFMVVCVVLGIRYKV